MGWRDSKRDGRGPVGAVGFYVVAVMSMVVSVDTSWRFFEHNLHITDIRERIAMFAVLEVALIACGYGMRANVHAHGRPGAPRLVAWVLCGIAAYMAWQLSGVAEGIARVVLGPVLGLVMLHLALGIEIRAGHARTTAWARVAAELRERLLSRLGLADDTRDALGRTRDRAVARAARLALAGRLVPARSVRLTRALRTAQVAHDPDARRRLLAELATARHAGDLAALPLESPWRTHTTHTPTAPATADGDAGDRSPATRAAASVPAARTRRAPKAYGKAGTPKRGGRVTKADYLARAREALADPASGLADGETVTAQWVQAAVPGISRSMSYVVADELTTERTSPSEWSPVTPNAMSDQNTTSDAADVVDAIRLVSTNGSAR